MTPFASEQVPRPLALQTSGDAHDDAEQQAPFTQLPLAQAPAPPVVQLPPLLSFGTHDVPLHQNPLAHSLEAEQFVRHPVAPHV